MWVMAKFFIIAIILAGLFYFKGGIPGVDLPQFNSWIENAKRQAGDASSLVSVHNILQKTREALKFAEENNFSAGRELTTSSASSVQSVALDPLLFEPPRETRATLPLKSIVTLPSDSVKLSRVGVHVWTNDARIKAGLKPLSPNATLDSVAEVKAHDILSKHYFAHVSPAGIGPAELVEEAGYRYILVGENLALGNFKDDQTLVQAWMDSPGHRENILNPRFSEIGIAVEEGWYEGNIVLVAVQTFALPRAACPEPDFNLKTEILAENNLLETLNPQASALLAEIEAMPENSAERESKIISYNELVRQINSLVDELEDKVASYNNGVRATNICITGI